MILIIINSAILVGIILILYRLALLRRNQVLTYSEFMEKYGYDLRFRNDAFKLSVYDQYLLSRRLGKFDLEKTVQQLNKVK